MANTPSFLRLLLWLVLLVFGLATAVNALVVAVAVAVVNHGVVNHGPHAAPGVAESLAPGESLRRFETTGPPSLGLGLGSSSGSSSGSWLDRVVVEVMPVTGDGKKSTMMPVNGTMSRSLMEGTAMEGVQALESGRGGVQGFETKFSSSVVSWSALSTSSSSVSSHSVPASSSSSTPSSPSVPSDSVPPSTLPREERAAIAERIHRFKTVTRTTTSFGGSVSMSSNYNNLGNTTTPTAAPTTRALGDEVEGDIDGVANGVDGGQSLETGIPVVVSVAGSISPGVPVPLPVSPTITAFSLPGLTGVTSPSTTAPEAPTNTPSNKDDTTPHPSLVFHTQAKVIGFFKKKTKTKPRHRPHPNHPNQPNHLQHPSTSPLPFPLPTGPFPTDGSHLTIYLTSTITHPEPVTVFITTTYTPLPATFIPHLNLDPEHTKLLHAAPLPDTKEEIEKLFHPPENKLLSCYHTGRSESRTDMIKSIKSFCRYLKKEAEGVIHSRFYPPGYFSPERMNPGSPSSSLGPNSSPNSRRSSSSTNRSYPLTGYRHHQFNFIDRGFIFPYTHVLVSLEIKPGCEWHFDQKECETYLKIPVDQCQRKTGEQFKKGGMVQGRTGYGDWWMGLHVVGVGPGRRARGRESREEEDEEEEEEEGGWERGWIPPGGDGGKEKTKKKEWEWGRTEIPDGRMVSGWRGDGYLKKYGETKLGEMERKLGLSRTCLVWRIDAENGKVWPHENADRLDWKDPKPTSSAVLYYEWHG